MVSLFRRGWKLLLPAVVLLTFGLPAGPAKAQALGPCGYAEARLGGSPIRVPLVTSCEPGTCGGFFVGPTGTGFGNISYWQFVCVRA